MRNLPCPLDNECCASLRLTLDTLDLDQKLFLQENISFVFSELFFFKITSSCTYIASVFWISTEHPIRVHTTGRTPDNKNRTIKKAFSSTTSQNNFFLLENVKNFTVSFSPKLFAFLRFYLLY